MTMLLSPSVRNGLRVIQNNPDLRADAIVVANYYMETGYFKDTAREIIGNDTFIPTYSQYNKMVKNKYAQKGIGSTLMITKV